LVYTAEEVSADEFNSTAEAFFAQGGKGLNCTVPLKELAWAWAARKTERAELAKAVNTLVLQADGSILGDNTDGCGLVRDLILNHGITSIEKRKIVRNLMLGQGVSQGKRDWLQKLMRNNDITLRDKRILLLGAGGASRGILLPLLEQLPACIVIANRTVNKAIALAAEFAHKGDVSGCGFADLSHHAPFDVILNATSASLSGQLPPLPEGLLAKQSVCYDLAYGNEPTAFVRWGLENGAIKSLDGLGMLVEQAAEAFFIWRGVRPETLPVIALLNAER